MNTITSAAVIVLIALVIGQAFAADQQTGVGKGGSITNQAKPIVPQPGGITTSPPQIVADIFKCPPKSDKCSCDDVQSCGNLGRANLCKAGTFKEDGKGGGTCTKKAL